MFLLQITYLLFASCRCYLLFQSEHVVLIYFWIVSLFRSSWECAHIQFNLWSDYYMFLYDGPNFTMREVASSANTYADCHYIYHNTHIQYLRHKVSVGNRFSRPYIIDFSLSSSSVSSRNLVFFCDGCQEAGACF